MDWQISPHTVEAFPVLSAPYSKTYTTTIKYNYYQNRSSTVVKNGDSKYTKISENNQTKKA